LMTSNARRGSRRPSKRSQSAPKPNRLFKTRITRHSPSRRRHLRRQRNSGFHSRWPFRCLPVSTTRVSAAEWDIGQRSATPRSGVRRLERHNRQRSGAERIGGGRCRRPRCRSQPDAGSYFDFNRSPPRSGDSWPSLPRRRNIRPV
jgi:hypothetical protein